MPKIRASTDRERIGFLFMTDMGWACLSMLPEYYMNPFE